MTTAVDVVVIGAGHNGLVAALLLAKAGLSVRVLERAEVVGGACRTEYPFARAPNLPTSTGAYLLGLMPPELYAALDLDIPTIRRDPHYFLPTTTGKYLLFGSDQDALRKQFVGFFSEDDWRANEALQRELAELREDVAPTWMQEPHSIEETAERFVRPALRRVFIDLCRGTVGDYLDRFGFRSDFVKAMYAVTDGFSGLYGGWDTPGTGMNFLVHNMCRLPHSDGTWMIVRGGMGTVTQQLAERARRFGAQIETARPVESILHREGRARGVRLASGEEIEADIVVANADPFRMRELAGREHFPSDYNARIDGFRRPGSTLKINLALREPPRFSCLPDPGDAFGPTIHLLPEQDIIGHLRRTFAEVQAGRLPDFPTIEWYIHSTVDPSLRDEHGHLSSALFVQWVPYALAGGASWETEAEPYARHLLSIADRFAPGTSDRVQDMFILHPQRIESYFGMSHGHIHHVDNGFGFADRLPYATPIAGLYSCSAGTHPAGSVIGCAGHNAAQRILRDLA